MTLHSTPLDVFLERLKRDLKYLFNTQGYRASALALELTLVLKEVLETEVYFPEVDPKAGVESPEEAEEDPEE